MSNWMRTILIGFIAGAVSVLIFHQFGFSAHGFQLVPGSGAVMDEILATCSFYVPIDLIGIALFAKSAQP